jgi:nucleoside-diphosphate-sugar epimerase
MCMEQAQELHVVFGSGVLGKNAARELVRMGKRVRVINRSGHAAGLPELVEIVKADAYDIAQTRALTQGATSIYQCAQPAYHEWEEKFPPLQASILAAAADSGAKLVVADNLYMYGDTDGQPMTENLPYKAHTRKGRVRAALATAVQDAHTTGKVRATIARASDFFGPEDAALSPVMFGAAVSGKPANLMGRVDQSHTFSYAPDFGRTLALLGTRDEALGEIWHIPSNAPMTQQAFVNLVAEVVGHPVKTRVAGSMMLSLLGMFNPTLREMPEMLYEWQKPFVMDDSKIRKAFGVQPTPMRQAVQETVGWFRAQR